MALVASGGLFILDQIAEELRRREEHMVRLEAAFNRHLLEKHRAIPTRYRTRENP